MKISYELPNVTITIADSEYNPNLQTIAINIEAETSNAHDTSGGLTEAWYLLRMALDELETLGYKGTEEVLTLRKGDIPTFKDDDNG